MDKTQDPDTFFNQLLLINSVEEADALIAANQDHFTRHFIRRVFEAAYQLLEHNPEEVQGMLNVLTYAVNQLAAPLLMGDLLILRADWERRFEQSDRFPWLYAAALDEYRKVPDQAVSEIAVCLFNLGLAFFQRGEFKQAIDFLEQAIHHNLATRQPAMAVKALHLRGRIAHIQGDLAGAQARFNQALAIAEQHNLINDVLGQLNNLGMLHVERGELDTAEECYRQVLERSQAIDYTLGEAMATGNLGIIALERSSLDEADAFFRRAEAMYEALDEPEAQASNLGNLALVAYRARDLEEAQQHCEAALKLQRHLGSPEDQLEQLLNLAVIHQAREDFTSALCLQDEALEMARLLRNRDGLFRGLVGRGDTYVSQGDPHRAHADYREAIEIIEELRGHLVTEEHRIGFLRGGKATVYQRMVQLVWSALRRPGEALEYSERARSRALLELLATTPLASPTAVNPTILAEEQVLTRALRVQQQALRSATNDQQRRAIADEIAAGQQELRQTIEALLSAAPEYAALRLGHPLSVAGIKGLLRSVR